MSEELKSKRIYFVRHGQTEANTDLYVPKTDEPLNENGQMQAAQVAERVSNLKIDHLVASDYLRAQQTAKPISEAKGIEIHTNENFKEVTEPSSLFGVSESSEEVHKFWKERNDNLLSSTWSFEDGESFYAVMNRVNKAKDYLSNVDAENILVVSHSVFSRMFAAAVLLDVNEPTAEWYKLAYAMKLHNTSVSLFALNDGVWKLWLWNDHAHFAE